MLWPPTALVPKPIGCTETSDLPKFTCLTIIKLLFRLIYSIMNIPQNRIVKHRLTNGSSPKSMGDIVDIKLL
ncbi:hypothetical protein J18TS1_05740 [Oceanobacillus oncorhynchi subsp. incaldanensis]|nr:hypothetical protein J18TS1_05740 [Oceanobacillus oncorhynchi subsp. incaldanensis]